MSEWIDIEDALPEFDSVVLVAFTTVGGETNYTTAQYVNLKYCARSDDRCPTWYVHVSGGHTLRAVTHWMEFERVHLCK